MTRDDYRLHTLKLTRLLVQHTDSISVPTLHLAMLIEILNMSSGPDNAVELLDAQIAACEAAALAQTRRSA